MKKKIVIGISGGIASGKSLVSEYIKNKGYKMNIIYKSFDSREYTF